MSLKTYHGSCHCKKIQYQAEIDLSKGTGKCNCSFCAKVRNWSAIIKPESFKLTSGEADLKDYQFTEQSLSHHHFCGNCGVRLFTKGYVEEIGGHYVSVALSTLDDVTPAELAELPVQYQDGFQNAWWNPPQVTKHL